MTVYVDDMHATAMGAYGRMKMSHLVADTDEELHAMAAKIGVARRWFQHPGEPGRHYDIALSKRRAAVQLGAVEVSMKQLAAMVRCRALAGDLGDPATAIERRNALVERQRKSRACAP